MTTIGFIGSGHIGSQLARLAVGHGYDVVVSNSRGPESLADLVGELGPHARAGTPAEAAAAAEAPAEEAAPEAPVAEEVPAEEAAPAAEEAPAEAAA